MPSACAPTVGRSSLEGRASPPGPWRCLPSRARASRSSSFSLPPSRQRPGTRQSSRWTSAVCEARMPCFLTSGALLEALGAGRDDEARRGRASRARGRPTAITTWTSAMPPLVAQAFCAVEHPLVGGLVVLGAWCGSADDVGAGVGLGRAEGGDLDVVGGAEALRASTRPICSGVPVPKIAGDGERGAEDRHADAGVAPEELLVDDREASGRSGRPRTAPIDSKP